MEEEGSKLAGEPPAEERSDHGGGVAGASAPAAVESSAGGAASAPPAISSSVGAAVTPIFRKKRGRPRKYGPGGTLLMPLSPMPISASVPAGDIPVAAAAAMLMKRGRGRPAGSLNQYHRGVEMISFGTFRISRELSFFFFC